MKKYEYKLVKEEGPEYTNMGSIKSFEAESLMLTGYGLEGWRVHSLQSGKYWLLEREVATAKSGN